MGKKPTHVWVGCIPDIFGYGIQVVALTEAAAIAALREAYDDWKTARPDTNTNFDSSFAYYCGYVDKIELGKAYHDGFRS